MLLLEPFCFGHGEPSVSPAHRWHRCHWWARLLPVLLQVPALQVAPSSSRVLLGRVLGPAISARSTGCLYWGMTSETEVQVPGCVHCYGAARAQTVFVVGKHTAPTAVTIPQCTVQCVNALSTFARPHDLHHPPPELFRPPRRDPCAH